MTAADLRTGTVDLRAIGQALWRHRLALVLWPAISVIAMTAWVLSTPREWTATTKFSLAGDNDGSRFPQGLAGLAAPLGLNVGASGMNSLLFFVELAKSREVLTRVAQRQYDDGSGQGSKPLAEWMRIKSAAPEKQLHFAVRRLVNDWMRVTSDEEIGIVTLEVTAPRSQLAESVTHAILEELSRFNIATRQSGVRAERKFIEARLNEAEASLRRAEDQLRSFHVQNRMVGPSTRFEQERLERQLSIETEVYLTLRREYERAKIDEVKDTPVITVIDAPAAAPDPDSRNGIFRLFFALIVGFMAAVSWTLIDEYVRAQFGRGLLPMEKRSPARTMKVDHVPARMDG